jgi:hypothetical protein
VDDARAAVTYDRMVPPASFEDYYKWLERHVEILNHALEGIPEDRIRYHVCWGSWPGPHTTDVPLRKIVDLILKVNAGAYLLEAANPRHEHEWKVWQEVKLPPGKILVPGVVSHGTNVVEASGAHRRASHAVRLVRRPREPDCRHRLRLRAGRNQPARASIDHVGEAGSDGAKARASRAAPDLNGLNASSRGRESHRRRPANQPWKTPADRRWSSQRHEPGSERASVEPLRPSRLGGESMHPQDPVQTRRSRTETPLTTCHVNATTAMVIHADATARECNEQLLSSTRTPLQPQQPRNGLAAIDAQRFECPPNVSRKSATSRRSHSCADPHRQIRFPVPTW